MASTGKSRREFLTQSASGLGAAWLAANYPAIAAAQEFVRTAVASGSLPAFAFFTAEQAVEVEAMTAEIIPTDESPGAREAHVVAFIDRALVTFERDRQQDYRKGLEDLAAQTAKLFPGSSKFSALPADAKIKLLTSIEQTSFFGLVRAHTITGFFSDPVHGGNREKVGWQLVGWSDALEHTPPFGYYDALPRTRASGERR
jgi:gluconate 2-dehydrogenase gamma chain